MKKVKGINTSKCAERMLIALVKEYDWNPAMLSEPGFGLDGFDLAGKAGIISAKKVEEYRKAFFSGYPSGIPVMTTLMEERDWVEFSDLGTYGEHSKALFPTVEGIDRAHWLMHPWYHKALDALKGDVRTIVVAVITAIVITLLTTWILRLLGW